MSTGSGACRALLGRTLPLNDEIDLRYALGKYFDDIGSFEEAFGQYRRRTSSASAIGPSYDGAEALPSASGGSCACATRPSSARPRAYASDSELPVFIIGMPRSGTSLAEQILASHPAVLGAGEIRFWDKAFETLEAAARAPAELAEPRCRRVARAYLERLRRAAARRQLRIIDKMPANFLYAGLIHAAFPRARIIHMRRHPLDTCLSIYFQNFFNVGPYANDLKSLAHYYGEYLRICDYWRRVLPATSFLEVPYEALIEDQEGWSRRMVEFLGLPWDPRCLEFHKTERVVITASRWQVRQKPERRLDRALAQLREAPRAAARTWRRRRSPGRRCASAEARGDAAAPHPARSPSRGAR